MKVIKRAVKTLAIFILCIAIICVIQIVRSHFNDKDSETQRLPNESYRNEDGLVVDMSPGIITEDELKLYGYETIDDVLPGGLSEGERWEEKVESWKTEESDIEGMTKYDKYIAGLDVEDGSDSDKDGLTDKEEIEVYNSDPLNPSTAGDLYTDGYKVDNGFPIKEKIEYAGEYEFPYCKVAGIEISPASTKDFKVNASDVFKESYDILNVDGHNIYTAFWIGEVYGAVTIDIKEATSNQNLNASEADILLSDDHGTTFATPKFSRNKETNTITIKEGELNDSAIGYIVAIVDRRSPITKLLEKLISNSTVFVQNNSQALIIGSPLASLFRNRAMSVLASSNQDISYKEYECINSFIGEPIKFTRTSETVSFAVQNFLYDKLKVFLPSFEFREDENKARWMLFTYCLAKEDEGESENVEVIDSFVSEELPFQNFGSFVSHKGNCAGIAHLTSLLHNTGNLPASGVYDVRSRTCDMSVFWDISGSENATLLDLGLSDYKDADFYNNRKDIYETCPYHPDNSPCVVIDYDMCDSSEQQFVNMIGCFWAEGNDNVENYTTTDPTAIILYKKTVDDIIKDLDNGIVCDVYMAMASGSYHTVNIYSYQVVNNDSYRFFVYDSNYPGQKMYMNVSVYSDDTASYEYSPFGKNSLYFSSSDYSAMTCHHIGVAFVDNEWRRY